MQSSRGPPPHGAAPSPTDRSHTHAAVPGAFHASESVPSSPPFFYMNPQTDQQHLTGSLMPYQPVDHYPLTSTSTYSNGLGPAGQWQTAARTDANTAVQGCSCLSCSATRYNDPPVWRTTEHQNTSLPGDQAVPFVNRNPYADNPMGIASAVNDQTQTPQVPQVPTQDIAGYAPLREETRITQSQTSGGLDQTQVFDMSTAECLRRLAGLYVNSPESLVNVVRLEPGASGRFRIVIILEVAHIF